jgi:SAM-dependent methyltransferase
MDLGPRAALVALTQSGALSQAVRVAAELKLADLLAAGPKRPAELAQATETDLPSLHRLLRALASLGCCAETEDGAFALTPTGALLRSHAAGSLRSWILWSCKYQWPVWEDLLHSVRTGESARNRITGTDGFGHLVRDPEAAAVFNDAMVEMTRLIAAEVIRVYDFGKARRIVDIGGGFGALLTSVLAANPAARGTLLDLPHAIEGARAQLARAGLAMRCDCVAGDFFAAIPGGADVYLMKSIIHDWDDARSAAILANCRRAMPPGGKLLLIERLMPPRMDTSPGHRAAAWSDLTMLIGSGGQERTEREFAALLEAAGLRLVRVIATAVDYCILEALPH